MIALWLLSLAVAGGLAYVVGFKRGRRSEDAKWVERMKDARQRGREAGRQEERDLRAMMEETERAAAASARRQRLSARIIKSAATRRRNREARGL